MEKTLYIAYDNRRSGHDDYPIAYILADDEDSAKIKALDVLQEQWEIGKIGHEKFFRETLQYGKRKIPDYEKDKAGPKPMKIEDVYVMTSKENTYIV